MTVSTDTETQTVDRIVKITGYDPQLTDDPSDPEGNLDGLDIVYGYDDDGNLMTVMHKDADGNVISQQKYSYTPGTDATVHNLVSYTDPNGNITTYTYDVDDTQKPDLDGATTPTPGSFHSSRCRVTIGF